MDFTRWNHELGAAFLDEGPGRPVYFAVTEAELRHLNDTRGLGMDDPLSDLKAALSPYSFRSFAVRHRQWERERSLDLPPWLPFLAATTIVVDRETEVGSTRFYDPLSALLGSAERISQVDYEETFGRWWSSLKRWLEAEDRNAGQRGFATWGSIPQQGLRSVIGHPYTQVLLRREERGQVDDFIAEFDHAVSTPPTARDRQKVAVRLVDAFRRWARHRRAVSPRLRRILESPRGDESLSLGYVLLGRLFDEISGEKRLSSSDGAVRIVPAYDDYERALRLVAIGPSWASSRDPATISGAVLYEPGEMVAIDRPASTEVLSDGLELQSGQVARLTARDRYVLAARDYDLWCEVDGVLPDEELRLLLTTDEARRNGFKTVAKVSGLPDGWAISGSLNLDELPPAVRAAAAASSRRLVPRLTGGLLLQTRVYLTGGEPALELPDETGSLTIDGTPHSATEEPIRLSQLDLGAGEHTIEIDGFELAFESVASRTRPDHRPALGRNRTGIVVPIDDEPDSNLVTGARMFPTTGPTADPGLVPRYDLLVKLGAPGRLAAFQDLTLAPWALGSGLPHLAIEIYAKSTYTDGNRVITYPWWIAWPEESGTWTVAELPRNRDRENSGVTSDVAAWRRLCDQIGMSPKIWRHYGHAEDEDTAERLERWREYARSGVGQ